MKNFLFLFTSYLLFLPNQTFKWNSLSRFQKSGHPENWIPYFTQIPSFQGSSISRADGKCHHFPGDSPSDNHMGRLYFAVLSTIVVHAEKSWIHAVEPRNVFRDIHRKRWRRSVLLTSQLLPLRLRTFPQQFPRKMIPGIVFTSVVFLENDVGFLKLFRHWTMGSAWISSRNEKIQQRNMRNALIWLAVEGERKEKNWELWNGKKWEWEWIYRETGGGGMIDWIIITEDLNRIEYTHWVGIWQEMASVQRSFAWVWTPLSLSNKFSVSLSKSNS